MKHLVPIFHGRVSKDGGRLELLETERSQRHRHLQSLAGQMVEVVVRRVRTQRSLNMSAYLHAQVFPILAEAIGDDIESVKFDVMGECFGWHTTKTGERYPVKGHTSEMTREESAYFVDWVIPWAARKFGVDIPLPRKAEAA
jgi:hypothetical protein